MQVAVGGTIRLSDDWELNLGGQSMRRMNLAKWITVCVFSVVSGLGFSGIESAESKTIDLKFANYYPPPAPQSKICEEFIREG